MPQVFHRDVVGRFASRPTAGRVVTFVVHGEVQLLRNLDRMVLGFPQPTLQVIVRNGGAPIREEMANLAPQAPGKPDLRDNIVMADITSGVDLGVEYDAAVAIGPSSEFRYGFFQEFGTIYHPAQPFARPAFDRRVDDAIQIMAADITIALHAMFRGVR